LIHYGNYIIRKTLPLALGLVTASNPVLPILDTLSKHFHDNDLTVVLDAIFATSLVCASISIRIATAHDTLGEVGLNHSLNELECVDTYTRRNSFLVSFL
jgi:hypothetical protein